MRLYVFMRLFVFMMLLSQLYVRRIKIKCLINQKPFICSMYMKKQRCLNMLTQ